MSYILDALRKAERERHPGQPPSPTALPLATEPGSRRRLGPWLWLALGVGLGLNTALLAFLLTRLQPATLPVIAASPAPAAVAPTAASTPATPSAPRSLPPAREATAERAPPLTGPEPPQPAAPTRPVAAVATSPRSAAPPPAAPRHEPADKPALSELSRSTVRQASRERREEPSHLPLTPGSVTLAPASKSIPPLETLPADARRGIPTLNLDVHVHSTDPDKRFVVINGRRYREGERLGEGPVLETVTPDGAILQHQGGQRFRLSVRR